MARPRWRPWAILRPFIRMGSSRMGWFPGDERKAKDLADRMTQIISSHDSPITGRRILEAVEEIKPSAATMAMAMMKYREDTVGTATEHMVMAHKLMRVPLDILLAKEQSRSQWVVAAVSIAIGVASLVVAVIALGVSMHSTH